MITTHQSGTARPSLARTATAPNGDVRAGRTAGVCQVSQRTTGVILRAGVEAASEVAVDVDRAVACECRGIDGEQREHEPGKCSLTGEWVVRSACCRQAIVLCDPCLDEEESFTAAIVAEQATDGFSCRTCNAPFAPGATRRL